MLGSVVWADAGSCGVEAVGADVMRADHYPAITRRFHDDAHVYVTRFALHGSRCTLHVVRLSVRMSRRARDAR